jgi:hypothetical protein
MRFFYAWFENGSASSCAVEHFNNCKPSFCQMFKYGIEKSCGKTLFVYVFNLFLINCAVGQNLIPNESFELYEDCPTSSTELHTQVLDWVSFSETPDYFNACNNSTTGVVGVPSNFLGFEPAFNGQGYIGIGTYVHTFPDIREYAASQLLTPLTVGSTYYFSAYISELDSGDYEDWRCRTNRLGVSFFVDPVIFDPPTATVIPTNNPQIDLDISEADTMGWTYIQGSFVADQNYNWLAIGNFYDGLNTDTVQLADSAKCLAYLFIDQVCLSGENDFCLLGDETFLERNFVSVYPNPASEFFELQTVRSRLKQIRVFDIGGRAVLNKSFEASESRLRIDCSDWKGGIYFLSSQFADGQFYCTKIVVL